MNKIKWRGGALLAPVPPVMVTCGDMKESNIITIGWTGIINTIPPKTYISIRPSRYSYSLINKNMEFVINLTTRDLVKQCDFCGVKSGAKINKFELLNLTKKEANVVKSPLLDESPINLECKVTDIVRLGSHDMFLADIVAVDVAEEFIDKNGKFHLDKAGLVAYAHGEYFELGRKLGSFGFSVKKKKRNYPKGRK